MIIEPLTEHATQAVEATPRETQPLVDASGTAAKHSAISSSVHALPFKRAAGVVAMLVLLGTDTGAVLLAGYSVRALRNFLVRGPMPLTEAFFATAVLWIAVRAFYGLYAGFGIEGPEELRRSVTSTVLAALAHGTLLFAIKGAPASRFIAVGAWMLLIPMAWVAREAAKSLLIRFRLFGHPVVVLSGGKAGALLVHELQQNPGLGIVPVAIFDDDPMLRGRLIYGVPVLGPTQDANAWQADYPVREALVTIPRSENDRFPELILEISKRFTRVMVVADTFGHGALWARSRSIGVYSTLQVQNDRFERGNLIVKRIADLVLGVPLGIVALPVVGSAALLVKYFSPGPAFYGQDREGLDGRPIRIWKIRTMVPDADAKLDELLHGDYTARMQWQNRMKLDHDPRIVRRVGGLLRRSSIDELPQLWNVLRGDMSLVGPRPFPNYHLARFPREFRELRHQVPPGITGYWQITHRSEANLLDQQATDRYYIHNWSLWLDLWILFRTAGAVLNGKGAR